LNFSVRTQHNRTQHTTQQSAGTTTLPSWLGGPRFLAGGQGQHEQRKSQDTYTHWTSIDLDFIKPSLSQGGWCV
jgi:hypothetical protein